MAVDLPDDVEALRTFALEQSRRLADVTLAKGEADAEIERLQSIIDAFMRHRLRIPTIARMYSDLMPRSVPI